MYLCISGLLMVFNSLHSSACWVWTTGECRDYRIAYGLLAIICVIGMLDTFINDVLSDRWGVESLMNHRTSIYMTMAAINISFVYVATAQQVETDALLRNILDAAVAVYASVRDVQLRYVQPRKESGGNVQQSL